MTAKTPRKKLVPLTKLRLFMLPAVLVTFISFLLAVLVVLAGSKPGMLVDTQAPQDVRGIDPTAASSAAGSAETHVVESVLTRAAASGQGFFNVYMTTTCSGHYISNDKGTQQMKVEKCEKASDLNPLGYIQAFYWSAVLFTGIGLVLELWSVYKPKDKWFIFALAYLGAGASALFTGSLILYGISNAAQSITNFLGSGLDMQGAAGVKFTTMTWASTILLVVGIGGLAFIKWYVKRHPESTSKKASALGTGMPNISGPLLRPPRPPMSARSERAATRPDPPNVTRPDPSEMKDLGEMAGANPFAPPGSGGNTGQVPSPQPGYGGAAGVDTLHHMQIPRKQPPNSHGVGPLPGTAGAGRGRVRPDRTSDVAGLFSQAGAGGGEADPYDEGGRGRFQPPPTYQAGRGYGGR